MVNEARPATVKATTRGELPWVIGVGIGAVVLLVARAPFAISAFWAEDGSIFYQQARDDGVLRAFGDAYAGYFQSVARTAGAFAAMVPIEHAPRANWLVVALVVAWSAATVFVSSRTWVRTRAARLALATGVVALPVLGDESIANAANLHFVLLFPAVLAMISKPSSRAEWVNAALFVFVTTLDTVETLVFLPFAVYRSLAARQRRVDPIVLAWGVGTALHLVALLAVDPGRTARADSTLTSIGFNYVKRAIFENFSPVYRGPGVGGTVVTVIVIAVIAAGVWRGRDDLERAVLMLAVPGVAAVLWVFLGVRLGATTPRYAVFPAMCIAWSLLVATEVLALDGPGPAKARWAPAVVSAVLVAIWLPHWAPSDYRRGGPTWQENLDAARAQCEGASAEVVEVLVPPSARGARPWPVAVPCDHLDRGGRGTAAAVHAVDRTGSNGYRR